MYNADFREKFLSIFFVVLNLSLIYKIIPKNIVDHPINSTFLKEFIKPLFIKRNPTIITGREEMMILKNKTLFLTKLKSSSLKNIITAKKDPICKLISIDKFWFLKFRNSDINIRCEDELIGRNSVIPCITERKKISIIVPIRY